MEWSRPGGTIRSASEIQVPGHHVGRFAEAELIENGNQRLGFDPR